MSWVAQTLVCMSAPQGTRPPLGDTALSEGRGWPAAAFSPAAAGRVRGLFPAISHQLSALSRSRPQPRVASRLAGSGRFLSGCMRLKARAPPCVTQPSPRGEGGPRRRFREARGSGEGSLPSYQPSALSSQPLHALTIVGPLPTNQTKSRFLASCCCNNRL